MIDVQIHNEQPHVAVDESLLTEVVQTTLRGEGIESGEISVALVDDAAIHEVNRRFLDHDYPTDVISFLLDSGGEATADVTPEISGCFSGEVVISAETAAKRAAEFGWSPHDEIVLYLVHGLLHLAGYDDQTTGDRRMMRSREARVLSNWNLTPRYEEPPEAADDDDPDPSAGSTPAGGTSP